MENILDYVKEKWKLLTGFSRKEDIKQQLWDEIEYLYSSQHRYYHNLSHIAHLYELCEKYEKNLKNAGVIGFSILYHDIVYDTYRHDNEEQSAALAETHLKLLNVKDAFIQDVKIFIIATKDHKVPEGYYLADDLALFLDFDVAILAAEPELYTTYSRNIRQEYAKYPDDVYRGGRKQALQQILTAENIFNTPEFRDRAEADARENINNELKLL